MPKTHAERQESKYIRELRKQNTRLRRENAQLKKRNSRIENDFAEFHAELEAGLEDQMDDLRVDQKPLPCPRCSNTGSVAVFSLGDVEYFKCHECGKKGKALIH